MIYRLLLGHAHGTSTVHILSMLDYRALELRSGLTSNPVHTIYPLSDDSTVHSGSKRLLTASSIGLCHWNISDAHDQPILVAGTGNQGVCISLAYCPNSDNIVATFRPKVDVPDETVISQLSQAPFLNMGHHVQGSHVLVKRLGSIYQTLGSTSANVPGIRLPKSTIVELDDSNSAFACGDEATSNLVLQGLPSLTFTQSLQSYHPIRDVRYAASQKPGVICCLGQDRMQFFSQKYL
uniref:Cleavage/polyadenylation specificity factor A subunit N-terminal domain-containing protein n=1 Tax=Opuntia streptacantha TaxID=393608 RepID=A0A7C8YUU0_OPUST